MLVDNTLHLCVRRISKTTCRIVGNTLHTQGSPRLWQNEVRQSDRHSDRQVRQTDKSDRQVRHRDRQTVRQTSQTGIEAARQAVRQTAGGMAEPISTGCHRGNPCRGWSGAADLNGVPQGKPLQRAVWRSRRQGVRRQTDRHTDCMSVCTFVSVYLFVSFV